MKHNTKSNPDPEQARNALLHEMWYVDGRADALRFAWDCGGNLGDLEAKAQEGEKHIFNPNPALKDRMAPGASTRVYQDGYLAGIKDAIGIVSGLVEVKTKGVVNARSK